MAHYTPTKTNAWIIEDMDGAEVHIPLGTVSDVKFEFESLKKKELKREKETRKALKSYFRR